jgi:hypothetical protein
VIAKLPLIIFGDDPLGWHLITILGLRPPFASGYEGLHCSRGLRGRGFQSRKREEKRFGKFLGDVYFPVSDASFTHARPFIGTFTRQFTVTIQARTLVPRFFTPLFGGSQFCAGAIDKTAASLA